MHLARFALGSALPHILGATLGAALLAPGCALEPSALEAPRARGMYIPLKQAPVQEPRLFRGAAAGDPPLPIFLNRNGGTYFAGQDNSSTNRSSVVQSGSATLDAWSGSETGWQQVVDCVADEFARFNVVVTDVEPTGGVAYVEAVIGDRPEAVGLPSGVGGVAPIDTFTCSIIPRAVVYTFAEVVGNNPQVVCEITAQEVAHAFSLDHEYLASDPMTYLSYNGHKTFQDVDAPCGEYQPRACSCGGSTQNSVQVMLQKLGAVETGVPVEPVDDPIPPTVSVTSPEDGATLPESSTIQVVANIADDVNVANAELLWQFTGDVFACPLSGTGAVTCTRSGSTYTWNIRVGTGQRTFQVRATDAGGNVVTSAPRTITLSADGTPVEPPDQTDTVAPALEVVSPSDQEVLQGDGAIQIVATASDDQGLGSVELLWTYANAAFGCPLSQNNISCVVDGDTYTWTLNVSTGTRAFQVRAIDVAGNQTLTPERTISLTSGGEQPPPVDDGDDLHEDNDGIDAAKPLPCGTALDLVAQGGDPDWFTIAVEEGVKVHATVTATAGTVLALSMHGASGAGDALAAVDDAVTAGTLEAIADGATMQVQVTAPPGAAAADYRLAVTCDAGGDPGEAPEVPLEDDAHEPNNGVDDAVVMFCGQEASYVALDDDWFAVEVREGDALQASVEATAEVRVDVLDAEGELLDGATAQGLAGTARAASLPAGRFLVRVAPLDAAASYGLHLACAPTALPAVEPPASCAGAAVPRSSTLPGALALAFALLALRRRR